MTNAEEESYCAVNKDDLMLDLHRIVSSGRGKYLRAHQSSVKFGISIFAYG